MKRDRFVFALIVLVVVSGVALLFGFSRPVQPIPQDDSSPDGEAGKITYEIYSPEIASSTARTLEDRFGPDAGFLSLRLIFGAHASITEAEALPPRVPGEEGSYQFSYETISEAESLFATYREYFTKTHWNVTADPASSGRYGLSAENPSERVDLEIVPSDSGSEVAITYDIIGFEE